MPPNSSPHPPIPPSPHQLFHGWWIVAASFLTIFMFFGIRHTFGVFLVPMCTEMGWSRGELSLVFAVTMVLYGMAAIVWGWLTDRYSPRLTVTLSAVIGLVGYALTGLVRTRTHMLFSYGLLFGVGMAGSYVPTTITVRRWFHQRAGLAMGIAVAAVGAGGFILAPAARVLIDTVGWRWTYGIIGLLGLAIVPPFAWAKMRRDPQAMGLFPDGEDGPPPTADATPAKIPGRREILRNRTFWAVSFSYLFVTGGTYTIIAHIVAFAQDIGISARTGSFALGVIGLSSIAGRLLMGIGSDRIGRRRALLMALGIEFIAMLGLFHVRSAGALMVFSVVLGIGYGSFVPLYPVLMGDLFGGVNLAFLFGISTLLSGTGAGIGPFVAGALFDRFGNYTWAFLMVTVSLVCSAVLAGMIRDAGTRGRGDAGT